MNDTFTLYEFAKSLTVADIVTIFLSLVTGLVCCAGIIIALIRLKRHKLTSAIAVVLLLLMAVSNITISIARVYSIESGAKRILTDSSRKVTAAEDDFEKLLAKNNVVVDKAISSPWRDLETAYMDRALGLVTNTRGYAAVYSLAESVIQFVLAILVVIAIFQGRGDRNRPGREADSAV